MRWLWVTLIVIVAALGLSIGLGSRRAGALNVVGSTSIQPFAEMLAQAFEKTKPGFGIDVQGGGSTAGLQAAANNIADIGMCSRALNAEEAAVFSAVVIARDGLAIVVHPSNPVDGLTREQIRRMFAGDITNWRQVGGLDEPVRIIVREEGSGTREAFMKMIMGKVRVSRKALNQESNGAVKELVKHDPAAIGFMSLGLVGGELKALKVDGVTPSTQAVVDRQYPLVRPFLFVTKGPPTPCAQKFIDFVLSPEGQKILETEGLVPAK